MNEYHDPHAEIIEVGFLPVSAAVVTTAIGSKTMNIATSSLPVFVRPQSASFSERQSQSGDYVEQEFEAVLTDDAADVVERWKELVCDDNLVFITYTNGRSLIVGTDQAPVRCEIDYSGSPKTTRVSFRRNSPEYAKVLQSLT